MLFLALIASKFTVKLWTIRLASNIASTFVLNALFLLHYFINLHVDFQVLWFRCEVSSEVPSV